MYLSMLLQVFSSGRQRASADLAQNSQSARLAQTDLADRPGEVLTIAARMLSIPIAARSWSQTVTYRLSVDDVGSCALLQHTRGTSTAHPHWELSSLSVRPIASEQQSMRLPCALSSSSCRSRPNATRSYSTMEGSDPGISANNLGADHLGIDSSLLYETVTDAVAHCAAGAYLAVQAFVQSCKSPVVVDTIKSTSKTVIITAICHYVLLKVILWPIGLLFRLVNFLTFFQLQLDASVVVKKSMAIYPLLTILLIRYVYRSSMDKCFSSTLQKLDPKYAAHLADKPRLFKATMTERVLVKLGITGDDSDDLKTVVLLMVVGVLLRGWKAVPYVGWVVAPVVHFLSIRYMVGHAYTAAAFSVLAAISPGLERPVLSIVELWASSKVLGRSSMRYFMDRMVPRQKRCAFVRAFEYTIVSYFILPTALMRLPLLSSMIAFPAASLGAYALKDILSRKSGIAEAFEHL